MYLRYVKAGLLLLVYVVVTLGPSAIMFALGLYLSDPIRPAKASGWFAASAALCFMGIVSEAWGLGRHIQKLVRWV
jgi:hypothetical protein